MSDNDFYEGYEIREWLRSLYEDVSSFDEEEIPYIGYSVVPQSARDYRLRTGDAPSMDWYTAPEFLPQDVA